MNYTHSYLKRCRFLKEMRAAINEAGAGYVKMDLNNVSYSADVT
jgi:hypothetical protein